MRSYRALNHAGEACRTERCIADQPNVNEKASTPGSKNSISNCRSAMGRVTEAATVIDEAIGMVEATGELSHMAELLRVKGNVLLSMDRPIGDAEVCFTQSLDLSRRQGARAWELRTATDLAALWASQGHRKEARALLLPVFEQFTEGQDTADLQVAERLLTALN